MSDHPSDSLDAAPPFIVQLITLDHGLSKKAIGS